MQNGEVPQSESLFKISFIAIDISGQFLKTEWTSCNRMVKENERNREILNSWNSKKHKLLFKFAFSFLWILLAAALIGVLAKHDFLPRFTEHARELSKHRTRGEETKFHFVESIENFPHQDERLPNDLKPLRYKLDLRVNLTTLRYGGTVTIEIICNNKTRFVILHSAELDILNVSIEKRGQPPENKIPIERILGFKKNQQLCIELREHLRRGVVYFLSLKFKSKISDTLVGFYKSSYSTENGGKG